MKQGCPVNFRDERIDKHHRTPLMAAAAKGQLNVIFILFLVIIFMIIILIITLTIMIIILQVVSHLLSVAGIEINAQDNDGMTALMHAGKIGALEVY